MVKSITFRASSIEGTANTFYDMKDNLDNLIFQNVFGASFSGVGLNYDINRNIAQLTISSERLAVVNTGAVTFSQTFTSGLSPSASIESAWTLFRSQLTGTYTKMELYNNLGHSITVNDPLVQNIADALRTATTNTNTTVTIGSYTWRVAHGCVSGTATANSIYLTTGPLCSCTGQFTVRPMIKNNNWGGLNGSSCAQPTQTITLIFS
jgi:hypothetical protein